MEHCANQTPGTSRLTFNQDPHKLMVVPERYQTPGDVPFFSQIKRSLLEREHHVVPHSTTVLRL